MPHAVKVVAIALGVLLLVVVCLPFLISANQFKPILESKLSSALVRHVSIGNLRVSLLSGGLTADSLAIAEDSDFGSAPFLQANSLQVGVEVWPLIISRKLNVTNLSIDQPQVALLQSRSGRWNYSSLGGGSGQTAPPAGQTASAHGDLDLRVERVRIVGGRFSIGKVGSGQKPLALDRVNLEVRNFSPSAAFPFSLTANVVGGGDIKLEGKAGPINPADVELTPLSIVLDVTGLNLASALAGTAPDIGGIAGLHATGASTGGLVTLTGSLSAQGLKLAKKGTPARRPVQFDFTVGHDLRKHSGALQRGEVKIGSASATLAGTYFERGDSTVLDVKFAGAKMPVPELAELLPPLGIALPNGSRLEGGTATAAFTIEGPADQLVAEGSMSLDHTRLANFDLGTKITLIAAAAGVTSGPNTDIETFRAKLRRTLAGTAVHDLQFAAPGVGELHGNGTISPANALDFQMTMTVHTARSALISKTPVPFSIQGTAMDPVFRPDVRGLATTGAKSLLESEAQKRLKGTAGEGAVGILDRLLGPKKK